MSKRKSTTKGTDDLQAAKAAGGQRVADLLRTGPLHKLALEFVKEQGGAKKVDRTRANLEAEREGVAEALAYINANRNKVKPRIGDAIRVGKASAVTKQIDRELAELDRQEGKAQEGDDAGGEG